MDTTTSKNAVKKRRQRENRAVANFTIPATIADTNPPAIIAPNISDTTITNNPQCPDKEIEDLYRLAARWAAKQAWQRKYIEKQAQLETTATPQPPWNIWTDLHQEAENYYCKQLFRTAPIAVHAIVEPNATADIAFTIPTSTATDPATSSTLTDDDMDTVEKIEAKLAHMERDWAETRSGPFPEGVRNTFEDLRAEQVKQDLKAAQATNDIRHVTTTAAITIPASANTATPAIYITTATNSNSAIMKIEQQGNSKVREEEENGVEKGDRGSKRKTERREVNTGELQVIHKIQDEVRDPVPAPTAVKPAPHEHARFDWASKVDEAYGHSPVNRNAATANPDRAPPKLTVTPFNGDVALRTHTPATSAPTDCTPATYMPTAPTPVPPGNPVTPPQPALPKRTVTPLNDDVAPHMVSPVPMRPLSGQPATPSHLNRMLPSPAMPIEPVPVDPASVLPKLDPIAPVSTALPTAHGPQDFSALRSGTRNLWSKHGHCSYTAHPWWTYLGPQPQTNSPSKLPHLSSGAFMST